MILILFGPFTDFSLTVIWYLFPFYDALHHCWMANVSQIRNSLYKLVYLFRVWSNAREQSWPSGVCVCWRLVSCSPSLQIPWKQSRRREEEWRQVRRRNKMHLVICCCLKNCTCVLPPPPLHAVETPSFLPGFKREKQTASLCPSLPPQSQTVIHSVVFSCLLYIVALHCFFPDPSTWLCACQNLGQNVLAACTLLKSGYSLYSTFFHLWLLLFDKEQVQLVFTT